MILIKTTNLKDLSGFEIGRLMKLTLKYGDMQILLKSFKSGIIKEHPVVIAIEHAGSLNGGDKIVGWATIFDTTQKARNIINVFVSPPYRNHKIGFDLVQELNDENEDKELFAFPWNDIGQKFFANFGNIKVSNEIIDLMKEIDHEQQNH